MREINFYKTEDGKCPVQDFLDSLSGKVVQKILWVLKLIEELERVPSKYFKNLDGTKIYECRIDFAGNTYRLLGFFHNGNIVLLTNGFVKKTQKTPKEEIAICEQRMKDYLAREAKK